MFRLDKAAQDALLKIYSQFKSSSDITVSAPEYEQTTIDYLISCGLLEKLNASTLSGWAYIVKPTYEGKSAYNDALKMPLSKINDFIQQGEIIMQEEYHHVTDPYLAIPDYISGPKSDQWFSEISIYNDRTLLNHPLHDQIENVCKKHRKLFSPHEEMMGYLRALANDDEFFNNLVQEKNTPNEQHAQPVEHNVINYIDNSVTIGDSNRISKTNIGNGNKISNTNNEEKKGFVSRHPIIVSVLISLIVGFILMFSFWKKIINWIEGLF